jgi:hypothetical protein
MASITHSKVKTGFGHFFPRNWATFLFVYDESFAICSVEKYSQFCGNRIFMMRLRFRPLSNYGLYIVHRYILMRQRVFRKDKMMRPPPRLSANTARQDTNLASHSVLRIRTTFVRIRLFHVTYFALTLRLWNSS